MSKRDEESSPDIEVGMTTAERRRRRRRGTGLRVPSDNVPRTRAPSAPPPPVPEDPALAMSIAYSFSHDASGPVPRPSDPHAPMAPEAMQTVIDPPSAPVDSQDFEMNTREMSAVDLEALGLADAGATTPFARISQPRLDRTEIDIDVNVDEDLKKTAQMTAAVPPEPASTKAAPLPGNRHKTVALSEEDIEVIRAATQERAQTQPAAGAPPPSRSHAPSQPPPFTKLSTPAITARPSDANKTMPLQAIDVEVLTKSPASEEPMSVPDIDLQELERQAGDSGDIDVDMDDEPVKPAVPSSRPMRAQSVPPPAPIPVTNERKSGGIDAQHVVPAAKPATPPAPPPATTNGAPAQAKEHKEPAKDAPAKDATPPPPPAVQPKPPAPPPAAPAKPKQAPAAEKPAAKEPPSKQQRQWFVDLFDEDYLRTLPFLTPQATQAEAEFVIHAMSLAPGAQVLDLGCGYGRHAMELAARGFHVVGLDMSTPLLVRGGEEAHRRGLTINFVRGDMRELDFENQFDACYCLFSTFGYFDDETNKKTLQNVAQALKPNGKVLVEILNRDYVIADLPTRVWWEGDGCVVLEEVELNYFSSRIQVNRSVVFDDGRQLEQEISVRAYSLHEVGKLMHAAGFRVLEVSGGYQMRGRFLGNQSRHIIVLAERKDTSGS